MTQPARSPEQLRKIGLTILLIDSVLGGLLILFGQAVFGLDNAISLLMGLVLIAVGLMTYRYFRSVAGRIQETKIGG